MRPRRNGRGKGADALRTIAMGYSFNEAATKWSRKEVNITGVKPVTIGFNEAATKWSRKGRAGVKHREAKLASMRPRRNGRGKRGQDSNDSRAEACFNEAATK